MKGEASSARFDGALPKKYKLLIGMAFDASFGAAQYLSGVGCIYTAGRALKELFEERK